MKYSTEILIVGIAGFATSALLNLLFIAGLALPASWLWNVALVPIASVPCIGFARAFGLLLLVHLITLAIKGVELSLKLRDEPHLPTTAPVRHYRATGPRTCDPE
jgi:hypothetical protein